MDCHTSRKFDRLGIIINKIVSGIENVDICNLINSKFRGQIQLTFHLSIIGWGIERLIIVFWIEFLRRYQNKQI